MLYKHPMGGSMELLEDKKKLVTEELSKHYSLNKISIEEYERLIEYAHKIETEREFAILEKVVNEYNDAAAYETAGKREFDAPLVRNEYTILSSRKIYGPTLNEINGKIICILGDNHITIHDGDLAKDETVIHVIAVLGDIVVHIPDNLTVINKAVPILGGVFGNEKNRGAGGRKKLIIEGSAILGNITIKRGK
jgi:predicted membrane protein